MSMGGWFQDFESGKSKRLERNLSQRHFCDLHDERIEPPCLAFTDLISYYFNNVHILVEQCKGLNCVCVYVFACLWRIT